MKKVILIAALSLAVAAGVLTCVFFVFPSRDAGNNAAQEYWPDGEWRVSTPEEQGMDSGALADMINSIDESGMNVNSVTIIRNGYLVSETYFYPYQKGIKHAMNSCTKSLLSAVVGNAVEDGKLSLDGKVLDCFGSDIANVDARKQDMTVRDLISMTSGFDWHIGERDTTNEMLQSGDWAKFTLDLPMAGEPGKAFNYCNGAANIMSSIVQNAQGKNAAELFSEQLSELGITDFCWGISPEGTSIGYSGTFMLPDDAAKFGYLYLNGGKWNGKQLVPESWVEESTKQHASADWNPLLPGYGYLWWITSFSGYDGYAAMGYGGDYIFVVPDKELVAVFTGGMFNNTDLFYPAKLMDKYVVPAAKSAAALPKNGEAAAKLRKAIAAVQDAPAPVPVPLPDTAQRISGRTYRLEGNLGTLVFDFSKTGEFTFTLASGKFTAGLDGTFRISDIGNNGTLPDHNLVASRGTWTDETTLKAEMHSLVDGYISTYTICFDGDNINITMISNILSDQSFSGTLE